jgi:hypothetical protein
MAEFDMMFLNNLDSISAAYSPSMLMKALRNPERLCLEMMSHKDSRQNLDGILRLPWQVQAQQSLIMVR